MLTYSPNTACRSHPLCQLGANARLAMVRGAESRLGTLRGGEERSSRLTSDRELGMSVPVVKGQGCCDSVKLQGSPTREDGGGEGDKNEPL